MSYSQTNSREELLARLKRFAKQKMNANSGPKLSHFQNITAEMLGYNNWSMLHKHFINASDSQFSALMDLVRNHPTLGQISVGAKTPASIEPMDAEDEMRAWVRRKFTPLIDFAFYDSESENGFAWADEDLNDALQDQFGDKYPLDLIEKVALALEQNEGPWGIEDYGRDDEEA